MIRFVSLSSNAAFASLCDAGNYTLALSLVSFGGRK
jgi:hypothetical protein